MQEAHKLQAAPEEGVGCLRLIISVQRLLSPQRRISWVPQWHDDTRDECHYILYLHHPLPHPKKTKHPEGEKWEAVFDSCCNKIMKRAVEN